MVELVLIGACAACKGIHTLRMLCVWFGFCDGKAIAAVWTNYTFCQQPDHKLGNLLTCWRHFVGAISTTDNGTMIELVPPLPAQSAHRP